MMRFQRHQLGSVTSPDRYVVSFFHTLSTQATLELDPQFLQRQHHQEIAGHRQTDGDRQADKEVHAASQQDWEAEKQEQRGNDQPEDAARKPCHLVNVLGVQVQPDHGQHRDQRERGQHRCNQETPLGHFGDDDDQRAGHDQFHQVMHRVTPDQLPAPSLSRCGCHFAALDEGRPFNRNASMNGSISPSRTLSTLDVSSPVR